MNQPDLFEETLSKKIHRMEKWVVRIQKEIWFLKEVHHMSQRNQPGESVHQKAEQPDLFVI